MLHMRAYLKAERWDELMRRVLLPNGSGIPFAHARSVRRGFRGGYGHPCGLSRTPNQGTVTLRS